MIFRVKKKNNFQSTSWRIVVLKALEVEKKLKYSVSHQHFDKNKNKQTKRKTNNAVIAQGNRDVQRNSSNLI